MGSTLCTLLGKHEFKRKKQIFHIFKRSLWCWDVLGGKWLPSVWCRVLQDFCKRFRKKNNLNVLKQYLHYEESENGLFVVVFLV